MNKRINEMSKDPVEERLICLTKERYVEGRVVDKRWVVQRRGCRFGAVVREERYTAGKLECG